MLKKVYFRALTACGADARRARRAGRNGLAIGLNLHRVSPEPDPYFPPLHPRLFEELLRFLGRHFRVSTLADLGAEPGRPAVALSFDDGYHDFIEYALPLLDRHRVPANINLCPAYLAGQPGWEVELAGLLRVAPRSLLRGLRVPGFSGRLRADRYGSKVRFWLALMRHLKRLSPPARAAAWADIRAALGTCGPGAAVRLMTVADARGLGRLPEVGAHSYAHELMGGASDADLVADFRRGRHFFAEQLGRQAVAYAFPSGSCRPGQAAALRAEGVQFVLTNDERPARPGEIIVPRFTLYGDSRAELRMRASGYRPAPPLRLLARWAGHLADRVLAGGPLARAEGVAARRPLALAGNGLPTRGRAAA